MTARDAEVTPGAEPAARAPRGPGHRTEGCCRGRGHREAWDDRRAGGSRRGSSGFGREGFDTGTSAYGVGGQRGDQGDQGRVSRLGNTVGVYDLTAGRGGQPGMVQLKVITGTYARAAHHRTRHQPGRLNGSPNTRRCQASCNLARRTIRPGTDTLNRAPTSGPANAKSPPPEATSPLSPSTGARNAKSPSTGWVGPEAPASSPPAPSSTLLNPSRTRRRTPRCRPRCPPFRHPLRPPAHGPPCLPVPPRTPRIQPGQWGRARGSVSGGGGRRSVWGMRWCQGTGCAGGPGSWPRGPWTRT